MTREIFLHGKRGRKLTVQVDDEDYDKVYKLRPYMGTDGYPMVMVDKIPTPVQLFVLGYSVKELREMNMLIDHKDLNRCNAQKENLRLATKSQNMQNKKPKFTSKGVTKRGNKYIARIYKNKVEYYLGSFDYESDAAMVYNEHALRLFGPDARLNPEGLADYE